MNAEDIRATFADAVATFTPIVGRPNDADILRISNALSPLLLEIPYDDGATGGHNLWGIIAPAADYLAVHSRAFSAQPKLAASDPTIIKTTEVAIQHTKSRAWDSKLADRASFLAADRGVKMFLRTTVDETWYKELEDARTFYALVPASKMMQHLRSRCRGLSSIELIDIPNEMRTFYADSEGIPQYINLMEEAQRKADRGKLPVTEQTMVAIASKSVLSSGDFETATERWDELVDSDKTWEAWKAHYNAAHDARERKLLAAPDSSQFGGANAATQQHATPSAGNRVGFSDAAPPSGDFMHQFDGYMDNLANTATNEKAVMERLSKSIADLTEANSKLVSSNIDLSATNAKLTSDLRKLREQLNAANKKPSPNRRPDFVTHTRDSPNGWVIGAYCFSHGFGCTNNHDSKSCRRRVDNHKEGATRANTMNGSNENKGWDD